MPIPGDYVRVLVIYGADDKSPFVNVLYYTIENPPGDLQSLAQTLADNIAGSTLEPLRSCMAPDSRAIGVAVSLRVAGVVYDANSTDSAGVGALVGDSQPDYVAAVIRKKTAGGGKTGRGRWFIGCVPEGGTDTSKLVPGQIGAYEDLMEQYTATRDVGTCLVRPAHYSRKNGTLDPIIQASVWPYLQTQRRRRLRPLL